MKHKFLFFILTLLTLGVNAQNIVPNNISQKKGAQPAQSGPYLYQGPATPQLDQMGGNTGFPSTGENFFNICGMNYTYGSVMTQTRTISSHYNTNGTGFPATINISGLPASCFVVLHAFLYYDASYTEHSVPSPTVSITNPSAIVNSYADSVVGTGPAKCWGEQGTANYRVDVTSCITGNGNYVINFSGFANEAWEVDGATLFIIYQAGPTSGTIGSIFLFNGAMVQNSSFSNNDGSGSPQEGDSIYSIPVCNNTNIAQSFFIIADQSAIPGSYTTNIETADLATLTFPNNQWNFNVIPVTSTWHQSSGGGDYNSFYPYRNDYAITYGGGAPPTFDCYDEVMFGMYWQNTGCVNCLPSVSISSKTNLSCNGDNSGSIKISASNGTTPYTYSWGTGQTSYSSTITGLSAGTYTVTVEDAICNTAQTTVTLTQPVALISVKDSTGVLCYGGNTGVVGISSSSGTSPYTYSWSNGQTKSNATGLIAGTYTITIQDKHGCSETAAITVTQPAAPVSPAISANPGITCYGGKTTATLTTSGGTSPYTYSWAPTGQTTATATGLTAGTYTITIHDINGCTPTAASTTVVVTQPAAPVSPTISANPGVGCYGGSSNVTITTSGGNSPYTYSWAPTGQTTATATGLTAGTYTITITDVSGCTPTAASTTVVVTQPAAPVSPTISANPGVGCYGGTSSVTVTTSGGTSPYTYLWSPIGGTNATGTGLTVGTYTITIKDKNGCTPTAASTTVVVTQPAAPVSPTISANPGVSCYGGNSSVTVTTSGGTSPYTYLWSPIGGTNATGTGLTVGTYTITIHDINGCTPTAASTTVVVTQPAAPVSPTISANPGVSCYGGNSSVTVTTSGGTSPYTYLWSPIGGTNATGTGLTVGTYTITIHDINGCTPTAASTTVVVTQPAAPVSPTISANPGVMCYGGTSSVTVTTSGGTSPYTYSWAPIGGTNATGTGLTVGTYTITIKDINGCTPTAASTTVVVTQPAAPVSPTISANPGVSCYGGTTTATISTSGGTSPYTYSWAPIGGTNATGTGLTVGTYTVTIHDINGCTPTAASTTVVVTQPAAPVSPTISANPGVMCYGGTSSVTVTTSGGTSPYTYSWAPIGGTNATGTGLTVGTYTITIHDINGCTPTAASTTVVVTQPAAPVSPTISANPGVMCYGGTSSVTVTTSGGTSPYTYSWAPIGGTNATGTGLTVGTYTITIHDINGCTPTAASTTVVVTQPAAPVSPTISANPGVMCYGGTSSVTVTTSGGTSPYTYSWAPIGGTNATGTGLTVGTYTITIHDINGCTPTAASTTVVVTQPAAPVSPTITTNPGVMCYGGTSTVTVTTSGGTSPYTYSWAPIGGTNATGTGLTVGTYTITIKDKNGCTPTAASTTVVVTQPAAPVSPTISANPGVGCYGGTSSVTVTTSGGTSPYTYSWSPIGGTNATGTGLTVGTYTITIKDKNGCTPTAASTTVVVTQPAAPVSPTISANPGVSCYGGTTTATISTSGGTSPYTYSWSPIGGTNATGTGLTVGTYTITIHDINGCTPTAASTTVVVTQPAAPVSPTISANPGVMCYGGTSSVTVTTSGGTSPYTYSWAPIGGTNATGTGLTVGTYTITIKDKNGCTPTAASTTVVVTQPAAPVNPTISANTGILCYGGTTTATITTSGGTSPYTYSWAPIGGSNATGTGLTVGTYTVTIHDVNGCTATSGATTTVIITQPAAYGTTISSMHASCGLPTGSATVSVTGSTSPYTYSWNPSGQTASTATGLSAGIYTVTVTDINSCLTTASITVTQTSSVGSTLIASTGTSCYGSNDGTATVTTSGGTSPYTYTWWPIGGTNAIGTGLTAGTYTVNVVDAQGCIGTSTTMVTITQPTVVGVSTSANLGITCYGGTSSATLTTTGGTSPYTYSWAPIGGTNATGTGLTVGTYTVTVTDANTCTPTSGTVIVVVTQPAAPVSPTITANPGVACYGGTTTATITTSGGTSPYNYSWAPIGGTNATGTGLTVGTYTVTIKDINGCTPTSGATTVIVTQPNAPVSPTISANGGVLCYGGTTTATITTSGGTSPYTYSWAPIGGTNATGTGLTVGTYTVTIHDINGCTPTSGATTVVVTQPAAPVSPTISANPGVLCYGGTSTATITTSGGTSPYTYSWAPIGGTNATGTGLTVGTYTVTIHDINGCTATNGATTVVVTQPNAPVSPTISANGGVLCYGGTTTATITISGGTSPYTYSWAPVGGTNATGTGLTVGTYTVTIKDINGCTPTNGATTVIVTQPAAPVTPTISANGGVLCYGGTTTATISTSGGTSPYTYSWSPISGTNATGTGLTVGTYTVTIYDINGCTPTNGATIVVVTQPAAPVSPTISANPGVICYGGTTTATISTSGGTSPYTYSWAPIGGTNATGTGLTVGTYTVTIKDINGCTATNGATTVIITQPAAPVSPTISANGGVLCYGGTTTATIITSGGTSPYTYSWAPIGGTNATGTGLTVGTYTVTIKDINGCTATSGATTVVVTQPTAPVSPTISANGGIGCYGGTTTATISTSGGTTPYTYSWAPIGGSNATGTGLTVGTYTVTIKDINGCTATNGATIVVVTQPNAPVSPIVTSNSGLNCNGGITTATITTSGGTSPYTYLWSPIGGTNATGTGLTAGTYTVTIKDANGCSPTGTSTTVVVTQPAPIKSTVMTSLGIACNGGTEDVTISTSGGTSPYTYRWSPSGGTDAKGTGLTAGTYTIYITDNNGCTGTATSTVVTLTQPSMLSATARVSNSISCNGGTGTAIVTPSGGTSPYSYFWVPIGGTNATGTGLTAGTYTITVSDNNHCSPTTSIVTVVMTQPTPYKVTITANKNDTIICPGDTTTIEAIVSGGGGMVTYKWSTGATTSSITISDSLTTTYSAVVFTPCDTFTISQKITVYPIPTMTVCCNTKILIGEDTTLVATGGVGDIKTYKWTEPNGGITLNHDTGRIVIATPTVTTTYTVTGTDTSGCEVIRFVTIVIEIPCNFTVPNVFTPTYAGTLGLDNKLYINYAPNMDSWSITIFDRWGVQLFSSSDPFIYWDGNTSAGSKVPAGVYYYMINASCQGHNIQKDGYVQLIR